MQDFLAFRQSYHPIKTLTYYGIHETSAAGKLLVLLPTEGNVPPAKIPKHKLAQVQANIMEGRLGAELAAEARSLPTPFNDGQIDIRVVTIPLFS